MADSTVADLTVAEFRELVREAVSQSLTELLADPDEGMVLKDDFAEALRTSLREVQAGGRTTSLSDVLKDAGTSK